MAWVAAMVLLEASPLLLLPLMLAVRSRLMHLAVLWASC
jgi:hypothetical protein